jgi:prepilin-type N-terminal cleavage/methylation domain-containing protein
MKDIMVDKSGFSLIELLVVVAILAILAAIALPNYKNAQTRSKVSRVKNDFRIIATALEAYHTDANTYPIHFSTNEHNGVFGEDTLGSNRVDVLTTPVSYLGTFPRDPFYFVAPKGEPAGKGIGYFFYTWETFNVYGDNPWGPSPRGPFSTFWQADYYALRSRGPNGDWDWSIGKEHYQLPWVDGWQYGCNKGDLSFVLYDPTNGINSFGDIYRTWNRKDNSGL